MIYYMSVIDIKLQNITRMNLDTNKTVNLGASSDMYVIWFD